MAIRKKTTAQSETVRAEETARTAKNSPRTRTTAAATHKSPARKSVNPAPAESSSVEKTTFDVALHHEEIRREAYCNWLNNGRPQGSEHQDWIGAIEIVRARYEK